MFLTAGPALEPHALRSVSSQTKPICGTQASRRSHIIQIPTYQARRLCQRPSYCANPETDGYQTPNRYEIPRHGRWLTPDPLSGDVTNPQSLNRYAYVMNNPTTFTDPQGLECSDQRFYYGVDGDGNPMYLMNCTSTASSSGSSEGAPDSPPARSG